MTAEPKPKMDETLVRLTKRLAKGSGVVFIGRALGRFLGFALQIVLGRFLGASSYGLYALATSSLQFAGRITQLGLPSGVVRFVAVSKAEGNAGWLKGTLLAGFVLGGIVGCLGGLGLALAAPWISERFFHQPDLVWPLRLMATALPFYNLVMLVQSGLQGAQRMVSLTMIGLARQAATLLMATALVWAGFGVLGAVGGFAASAFVTFFYGIWILTKSVPQGTWGAKPEWRWKELLRFSLPMYLAGFSFLLMSRTDVLMLGYFTSPEEVGVYRASVALAQLVVFGLGALNTALAPLIADLYHRGSTGELEVVYKTSARWGTLLSLVVALPLLLFPREILGVYGAGFVTAAWALVTLVSFQLINAGVGSVGFMLQMSGRQDWVLFNNLFTAALNVGLNLWWIPRWGILGAGLATGLALALNNLLGLLEVQALLKMHPFSRAYARLGLITLAPLLVYFVCRWFGCGWIYGLLAVIIAFVGSFLGFGMTQKDWMVLAAVVQKIRGRRHG